MARGFYRQSLPPSRWHRNIQVNRFRGNPVYRPGLSPEIPADQAHLRAVIVGDQRNLFLLHFLIAGRSHFQRCGKIGPQLEPVHAARGVSFGHFLVNNASARGHPLHVAGGDRSFVAHAVAVLDFPGENIGNRLNPPVRMPGKPRRVVGWHIVAKIVQQQEGVELRGVPESECAAQMHARSFHRRFGLNEPLHRSNRHAGS